MKHKDRTGTGTSGRLQCGCQTLMTSNKLCKPQLRRQWTNTISFQDLKTGLGPSSEAWFENLTSEHEWHQREIVPANRQTGWSPCPSGGVLIVSASTPCPVKKVLQYNSPALWPTLLPESPVLESTTLSKSASSEDDGHNNSTATSLGSVLDGFDGDGGGDRHQLLAFSMDSADLSWSSSMATPPNAAVEKFSVTEEEERQKGPARVLFSPNTSAADSELWETDANITIEQEEASTSFFAPDLPLAAPQGTCPCKTTERREMSCSSVRAKPCYCEQCQVPVVEIHCSGKKSAQSPPFDENLHTSSDAWKESGVQDRVPGSLLPEIGWSSPLEEGEGRVPLWRTSTPRTSRFKALSLREDRAGRDACSTRRCHSLTSTPVRKGGTLSACVKQLDAPLERPLIGQRFAVSTPGMNHISSDLIPDGADGESKNIPKRPHQPNGHDILKSEVGLDLKASISSADFPDQTADGSGWQTPGQGRFNTSASKSDASLSSAMLSVNDPPMSPALHRHRKSLSKRGTRKNLANAHESEKTTSVDEALADFFSSPETSAKRQRHAPGKGVKRPSTGSALENLDREEPAPAVAEADTEHDSGKDHSSAYSKVGDERSCQSGLVLVEKSVRNGQTGLQTTTRVSDYPFEEAEAGIPNSDEATNQNVLIKNSTSCKTDIMNNGFGKTPVKGDAANHAYPRIMSTPPSILRSSGKQRQMSSSSKRVRFAADCKGKALTLKSKDKLRRKLATPDDVSEKEQKDMGQASVVTTVCSNSGGSECEVRKGDGKEWGKVLAASPSLTDDRFAPTILTSQTATTAAAENVQTLDATTRLQATQVCAVGTESATTSRSQEPLVYPDRDEVGTRSAMMPSLVAPDKARTESVPLREGGVQGRVEVNNVQSLLKSRNVQSLLKSHNVQSPLKSPPSHEKLPWSGNSGPMNQARGSVRKTPVAETSQDSGGTVGVQSEGKMLSTVEPQGVEITQKIGKEETSGGKKAEKAVTPAKSVAPPKLRLGLRKTPRFLYPSSSQIMETCPQNVYDFKAPGVAVKLPTDSVSTKFQDAGDRLSTTPEGRHPVLTASSEDPHNTTSNASNQAATIAPKSPVLATSSTLSTPNKNESASENYTNGKNSHAEMDGEGSSKGKEDILFKVSVEYEPMVMEEEPDWSEIDDCAMEECDIETALLADGQKLTTTLYETMCEMAQVPARGQPQAEGEESSVRGSSLGKAAAASKEAAPPTLSETASTLRASCSPAEQTDACSSTAALAVSAASLSPTTGSPPAQPSSSAASSLLSAPHLTATHSSPTTGSPPAQPSSSAASSLPPAPHLTATGSVSATLKTRSASLQALSSPLPAAAAGAWPGIGGRRCEGGPPAADQPADLEEDLQTELLCDVDFSQELLSQSKCGAETEQETETGGVETEQEAENGGVETEQEAENGGVETEQEAENGGVETEQEAENGGVETEQEAENGGVETEQEAENGGVETEQEAENGGVETEQEAENGGVETEQEAETGGVETEQEAETGGVETEQEAENGGVETEQETEAGGVKTEQETENGGVETEQKKETGGLTVKLNNRRMLPKSVATEGSVSNMNSGMPTDDGTESNCQTANEISASEKLCSEAFRMSMSTNSVGNMLENSSEKPTLCPEPVKFCRGVLPSEASPMPELSQTVQNLQLKQTPKPSSGPCLQEDQASRMLGVVSSAVPGGYADFRSAAGRLMKPTEKALATAEALFQEEDVAMDEACFHDDVKKASHSWSCHSDTKDFSHRLPERSPRTAKRFLDSYQSVGASASCNTDDMHKTADTSKFSGFKSASCKDVILSSKGRRKAEEMWKAVEKELQSDESLPCDADSDPAVVALSLAHESTTSAETKMSHSYIIPSKAARLSGEGSAHCNVSNGAELPGLGFEMLADDVGFKTAGGKAVSLSSKAQQRAVELWKCVEKALSVSADSLQVQDAQPSFPASEMSDFPVPLLSKHGSLVTSVEVTEKAELNLSFKAPLLSGPYHNVPQGFRPFKPPKLTKKEPDGERCKSQETEQSKGTQKNTILHHFSKVDLKEENNGSKRKHSDDFSDDDEYVWDIESMEQMGCKENCQLDEDRTVEPSTGAEPQVSGAGENQSQIQQATHHAREELGSEKNVAQSANSLTGSPCNVDANHNSTNPTDEEMSDAVLTELSRDMYELTQAELMPQKPAPSLPVQNEKHAFSDSHLGLDEQFLRQCSGAPLDIPSQGSRKSLGVVSVSFESLRCDENVSYEEKDSTTSHTDLNNLSNCEEEAPDDKKWSGFAQGVPLQIREPDFDSSIPDQIADSTFGGENVCSESFGEGQDQEIDSSDLEKDMLDISCLEKELDTSQVEVSGGVVWMEGKDCCEWDSVPGADAAAATLVSLDAIKEEKSYGGGLEETENGPLEASSEMKGLEEVLSEAFDADEACAAVDTETVEGKLVKRKAESVTLSSDKTLLRSPKRPRTVAVGEDPGSSTQGPGDSSDEPSDTSDGVFIEGNPEEGGTTTSPVDSLANLSWTDIASPFAPSQRRGGKHSKPGHMPEQPDETDDGERQQHGRQTDAGGDLRVLVPFSACASSPKVIEESEPGCNKTAGSSSKVDSVFAVTGSDKVEEDVLKDGDALHAALEHDGDANQFGADSEGFQITAGLSQLFSTQISQVMVAGKQTSFGDAPPEDAGLKISSIESVYHQNSSSQQEETQQADNADSAVLASRADATSNSKDAHKLLTSPGDIFRSDTLCQGFRTARGNLLRVSKKSLEKVQSLFQSDSESVEGLVAGSIRPATSGEPLLARPHGPVRLPVPSAMQLKTADMGPVQSPQPGLGASSRGGALSVVSKSSEKVNSMFEKEKASLAMTKDTSSSSLGFGFQTASGKAVVVSAKSVERMRRLFDDDSEVENLDRTTKPVSSSLVAASQSSSGFRTAEGGNVAVSETSLNHFRLMLEHGSGKGYTDGKLGPPSGSERGFQTARGESETVGSNLLSNARGLFQAGTGQAGVTKDEANLRPSLPVPQTFQGFQTASGTSVLVSKNALDRIGGLFSSDNSGEHVVQAKEEEQIVPSCAGFQTAGGGKVTVSAKSLHHAKAVLAECSEKQGFSSENECNASNEMAQAPRNFGFETAGGVKVSVSTKSVWHARKVLDSAENKDIDEISGLTLSKNGMGDIDALAGPLDQKFHGFQTAGGKSVCVSENALKNARRVLDSSENSSSSTQLEAMESESAEFNPPAPQALGFQTARGGNVSVSTRALQHAQRILRTDEELGTAQSLEPEAPKPEMVGFQTAGGDRVSVSHRSLQHAQNLLKDDTEKQTSGSHLGRGASPEIRSPAPPSNEPGVDQHAPRTTRLPPSRSRADDFTVPTCQLAPSPETSSLQQQPHQPQPHAEAMVLPGCHGSSAPMRGLGRRGKECLQPIVSDDSRVLAEGGGEEETSPGHVDKDAAAQQRVAVKRTALYADSEAILHDRSAKRFKLKAATAHEDGVQNISLPHPLPRMPHHSSMPRCTISGKSVPAFQPPYKKAKFTPPAAKKAGEGARTDTAGKPRYRPPPTLPTPHHAASEARPVSSAQGMSPGKTQSRGGTSRLSSSAAEVPADLFEAGGKLAESEGRVQSSGLQVQKESCGKDQPCSAGEEPAKRQPGSEGATVSGRSRSERNVDQSEFASGGSFDLEEARMRQEKIIRQRKRQKVRPVQGRWLAQKLTQPQRNLEDLPLVTKWRCRKELLHLGVSPAVCSVSSRNAEEFRFHLPSFYPGSAPGILVGDGALIIADRHGYAGKEEFYSAFLTVEGVDPGLVPEAWLNNHYRWIVWKLAAYEVALPHSFSARALTPDVVMFQLKYRYDREVDGCQRSALKRIVERDDTPCKRMVLCISDIKYTEEAEAAMLEVTDGWYCLPCKPDSALQDLIGRKKLAVGQKIVTTGAELAGSQESCSPLEICAGLHLKVFGNSTRPAPATAKLGYQGCPTPLCVPLSTLHPQGGLVGCLDIVVVRKYPLMFMEKLSGGGCVFRTLEMEEKAQRKHEEKRQTIMEKLCSQLQAQMEREEESTKRGCRKQSLRQQEVQSLTTGAEISAAMDSVPHPEELQGMLSGSQMAWLLDYRQRQQEEHQQRLRERLQEALQQSSSQVERCVVPMQKLRIVGCGRRDIDSKTGVMLTVWRPGQDWESVREGGRYRIYSLTAAPARCRSLGQHVEVTAGRQTRLKALSVDENLLDLVCEPREVYSVADLQQKVPPYGEFDFVGVIISIKTALRGSDAVYAADIKGDLLLICFWGGLQAFSLQGTLAEGAAFAASNLRFKSCRKDNVESCASLELSHFSLGGRTTAQRLMLQRFQQKDWKTQLFEQGREKLSRLKSASRPSAAPASEMLEDLPPSFVEKLLAPLTQESTTDTRSHAPSKEPSLNTSADDSFSASNTSLNTSAACTQALSPGALDMRRKMKAQKEKLARLQSYGRLPPLSPLPCVLSPAAANAFKPPTPQRR